jgi:hypothetical protein
MWKNKMVGLQNPHLAFSFMAIINKPLELDIFIFKGGS